MKDQEIEKLSFEDSYSKLEEIVNELENGNAKLEESISLYEMGIKLKNHCENKLKLSELRIKKVLEDNKIGDFEDK